MSAYPETISGSLGHVLNLLKVAILTIILFGNPGTTNALELNHPGYGMSEAVINQPDAGKPPEMD